MERLIQKVFKETINVDVTLPLPRLTYKEAMERFGSDKPDLRFGFELKDLTEIAANCGFSVFEGAVAAGGSVRAINLNGYESQFTRKNITELENVAKLYGAKGLAWMKFTSEGISSPIAKFMTQEVIDRITAKMDAKEGDLLLFVADKHSIVFNALGHVRLEAAKKLNVIDENEFNFLYVTEFPMFEYDEEAGRYVAMHHPFTSPLDEDFDKFETEPQTMRAKAYDMVLNGVELGGGSIRIYDPKVQSTMFKVLGFTEEDAYEQFGFLLDAFKYGTPPHGGLAFGLDRVMMLILNQESIRDVIAFPKNQNAICPLTNAPGETDQKALDELQIAIRTK
jgi:aspartyl-tRNA synthetase